MNFLNKKNNDKKNWTSKRKLIMNLQIDLLITSDIIEQIISDLSCRWPEDIKSHIKKGGFHNLETYYDDFLVAVITDKVKHNTNQKTDTIKKDKEQGILLNTVINSGNLKAAKELCDLIMAKAEIQAEIKKKSEQIKQIEEEFERSFAKYTYDDEVDINYDDAVQYFYNYLKNDSVSDSINE